MPDTNITPAAGSLTAAGVAAVLNFGIVPGTRALVLTGIIPMGFSASITPAVGRLGTYGAFPVVRGAGAVAAAAELPANPTQGVGMVAQGRQGQPGYARRTRYPVDQFDLISGPGRPLTAQASFLGTAGIAFGYGPAGKRTDVGSPSGPSQLQNAPGRILMLIPCVAGARTITIDARFYPDSGAGKRPRLLVKRDLDIGVQTDVSAEAGAGGGTAFVTITLNVTLAVDGVLECYREQQDTRADAWTLWDNLVVT